MTIVVQSGVLRAPPGGANVLQLHLDASVSGSVTESSNAVSQWNDLSGNGRHFTQSSGALKPTYPGTTQNGLNTMTFGLADAVTYLDCSSISISQRFLIFIVMIDVSAHSALIIDDTNGASRIIFQCNNASGQYALYAGGAGIIGATNLSTIAGVMCGDFNGATSSLYYNAGSEGSGDVGSNNMSTMRVGARFDGTTLNANALVGEIRIYTNPQSGDIASITTALRTKWGI